MVPLLAAGLGLALGVGSRRRKPFSFRGKAVVITGGSRGLGLVMARAFAAEGARLALCGRDGATLERARAELAAAGAVVHVAVCDVRVPEQVQAFIAEAQSRLGPIDVLVNNAGIIQAGPIESMTTADFEDALATHFWGPLHAMLAVYPDMKARGHGRIVNIASFGGRVSVPHLIPYSASKFALVGLSDGMRAELAAHGIHVTTVAPGLMRTGSPRNATFKGSAAAEYSWFTLGDSLPGFSVNAERAARLILEACRRGDGELVIGLPARVGVVARAIAPHLTQGALALANRLMPSGASRVARRGRDVESPLTRSWLTVLTQRAAARNNEVGV